jgi:hypothetical protein
MSINLPLKVDNLFCTPVYSLLMPTFLNKVNKISDRYIEEAKKINQPLIEERNKSMGKDLKDFGFVNHSAFMGNDPELKEFKAFIKDTSYTILSEQGYDLSGHKLYFKDLWVQEFPKAGGGEHWPHVHESSHISGFYFLKCSPKTSLPVFHDPRPAKWITELPLKKLPEEKLFIKHNSTHHAYNRIDFKVLPGTFVFFNSYLTHQYILDEGIEPFRFVHFNVQCFKSYEENV